MSFRQNEEKVSNLFGRVAPTEKRDEHIKKSPKNKIVAVADYDFSEGVRGKYAKGYAKGSTAIVLELDIAKIFGNDAMVNRSLRKLAKVPTRSG